MHMSESYKKNKNMDEQLVESLRELLADVTSFVFRTQAAHWNVTGPDFHQYHQFFGVIYEEVEESIDPLAENLRKLNAPAPSSIGEQIRGSEVDNMPVTTSPRSLVKAVYRANNKVLSTMGKTFKLAESCNKQGLVDFLGGRIDMHEKWGWQLRATMDGFEDYAYPEKVEHESKKSERRSAKLLPMFAAAEGGACPPATQDIELNLENRKQAIDSAMYGPLNPAEPNDEYWQELASEWNVDADTARQQTCGNCAMFNVSDDMKSCIAEGVGPDRFDQVDAAGELGYCEAFDFKCASARTCRAWVGGGPITAAALVPEEQALADALREVTARYGKFNQDDTGVWAGYTPAAENKDAEIGVTCANCVFYGGGNNCEIIALDVEPQGKCRFAVIPDGVVQVGEKPERDFSPEDVIVAAAGDPCWEGYVQVGMKEKDGKMVPNCVPADSSAAQEFAKKKSGASTPAPKKDQVKGSKKNKKGSASGEGKITFSKSVEKSLRNKMEEHNKKAKSGRKATMSMLKAVYRRGAGAYSTSHRPGKTRGQWAMARVNAYLRLLSSGSPKNSAYKQDNDLLPASHPKSTRKSAAIEASGLNYNVEALREVSDFAEQELEVSLRSESEYESAEEAILALTEFAGLGYELESAVRASWMRAVNEGSSNPFQRARVFATMKHESGDADLLPEESEL